MPVIEQCFCNDSGQILFLNNALECQFKRCFWINIYYTMLKINKWSINAYALFFPSFWRCKFCFQPNIKINPRFLAKYDTIRLYRLIAAWRHNPIGPQNHLQTISKGNWGWRKKWLVLGFDWGGNEEGERGEGGEMSSFFTEKNIVFVAYYIIIVCCMAGEGEHETIFSTDYGGNTHSIFF